MSKLRVLDLFSGIGGFSLGLERTGGFQTVAFCEIEPFPRRVLAKHWPKVPCYDDVRTLTAERLRADGIAVDIICGGFPCQDISRSGHRVGITGAKSRLWSEYARIIGEIRPTHCIVENASDLLSRGFDTILSDLVSLGYDAVWHCIQASDVGAPHIRDRVWILAYRQGLARPEVSLENHQYGSEKWRPEIQAGGHDSLAASRERWALPAPEVVGAPDGVPARVDRIGALGNAVVPALPELLGRAILASSRVFA